MRGLCIGLGFALASCAVGPDFQRPTLPRTHRYTRAPAPVSVTSTTGEPSQQLLIGARISARWWQLFRSAALDKVVSHSLRRNRTLAAARASLTAARETLRAASAGLYPQLDLSASAGRRKGFSLQGSGLSTFPSLRRGPTNVFSLGASVSYALDVFGGTRRTIERQRALTQYQAFQLAAAYLTVTGNAVTQAISIASLREQIRASQEVIASDTQSAQLVQQEFELGKVAQTDVLSAQTQLASDQTVLPPLHQQLSAARHALAVLTGRAPSEFEATDFTLDELALPSALPLRLPSQLARERPDILAAEAQLHAASAAIGVATAQLFPGLTLSASLDQQAFSLSSLFGAASRLWNVSAGILAPLFHGGSLRAQRRAAIASYRQALANYEQTVLQGLQQVADSLRALAHDGELADAEHRLLDIARKTLELQKISYAAGKTGIVNLLDAQRAYQQARLGYVRARAQRLQDSAQLVVALGGAAWQTETRGDPAHGSR